MTNVFVKAAGLIVMAGMMGCGGSSDPFSGTTWVSTTIPAAQTSTVTAFRESLAFGAATTTATNTATGPATLTLSITNSATASKPGCMEAWTFAGCTWTSNTVGTNPIFSLQHCVGSVARTGCTVPTDNQASMADTNYDGSVNGGAETFAITGTTAAATGNSGVPWDGEAYTFTKQ